MHRLIITGANGVGKSHFARALNAVRPGVPVISYDALKLLTNWQQRSRAESQAALHTVLGGDTWVIEGGPSMVRQALPFADALVWIDPPEALRAWRLALRPWRSFGQVRPELPAGNVDWPWRQYRFAWRSLRQGAAFRRTLSGLYDQAADLHTWHCRTNDDLECVVAAWADQSPTGRMSGR